MSDELKLGALTLTQAAEAVALSPDRFGRVWRTWCKRLGFPHPFLQPPLSHYVWSAESVALWQAERERLAREGAQIRTAPANDRPSTERARRLARRRALRALTLREP